MTRLNETYEVTIDVPVRLVNIPSNVVITTDIQDSVLVTLKDIGFNIFTHCDTANIKPIDIDFRKYASDYHGSIPLSGYIRSIHDMFINSTIVSIKPEKLEFFYNYGMNKKVPVIMAGKVSPEGAYYLSETKFWPDSVIIYATKEKLDSIDAMYIRPISINHFKDTLIFSTDIAPVTGVKSVPSVVKIGLFPDINIQESITIPISCRNLPVGKTLRTFPAKAKIRFVSGVKQYKELRTSDFIVEANYDEILSYPNKKTCTLRLVTIPDCIQRAELLTTEAEFIIEE